MKNEVTNNTDQDTSFGILTAIRNSSSISISPKRQPKLSVGRKCRLSCLLSKRYNCSAIFIPISATSAHTGSPEPLRISCGTTLLSETSSRESFLPVLPFVDFRFPSGESPFSSPWRRRSLHPESGTRSAVWICFEWQV